MPSAHVGLERELLLDFVHLVVEILVSRAVVVVAHDEVEAVRERPLQLQLQGVVTLAPPGKDALGDAVAQEVRIGREQFSDAQGPPASQRPRHDLLGQPVEGVLDALIDPASVLESDARIQQIVAAVVRLVASEIREIRGVNHDPLKDFPLEGDVEAIVDSGRPVLMEKDRFVRAHGCETPEALAERLRQGVGILPSARERIAEVRSGRAVDR